MSEVNFREVGDYFPPRDPVDPYEAFVSMVPAMGRLSLGAMRTEAFSYRNFHVGSTLMAYNASVGEYHLFTSGNYKLEEGIRKHCAEMFTLDAMHALNGVLEGVKDEGTDLGEFSPVGIVTVATSDKKAIREVTGKSDPTLHMCIDCQHYYANDPSVNTGKVISVTMPDHLKYMEVNRLQDYLLPRPMGHIVAEAAKSTVGLTNFGTWQRDKVGLYKRLAERYHRGSPIFAMLALHGIDYHMKVAPLPTGPRGLVA